MSSPTPRAERVAKLSSHLEHSPHRPAFTCGDVTLTFGQLERASRALAHQLTDELGLSPGERVAVWASTSLELVVLLLAIYRAGLIYVPINTSYGAHELLHLLEDSAPCALVLDLNAPIELDALASRWETLHIPHLLTIGQTTTPQRELPLRQAQPLACLDLLLDERHDQPPHAANTKRPARCDDDLAMFIYTSGTTGPSKGVMLSYGAIISGIDALTTLWRWEPSDHLALALPLFHVHGLGIGIHGVLLRGCHATLLPKFSPEAVATCFKEQGATIFMGVPTMYHRLIEAMEHDPKLAQALSGGRLFTSGSAALSAEQFERFEALTGHRILERYGMSETMLTISNPYPPQERRPGTIGHPIPGVEARIVDERGQPLPKTDTEALGELQVRGPTLMSGYWRQPQKSAEAFDGDWFKTGDVASYDAEGYIVHRGRQSVDIIKSGGYKISARELEELILTHPNIKEVAVLGRPDPEWGQRIIAAIVPTHDAPAHTPSQWLATIREHLDGQLAAFKHPKSIIVTERLPRNALGKLQKHLIQ